MRKYIDIIREASSPAFIQDEHGDFHDAAFEEDNHAIALVYSLIIDGIPFEDAVRHVAKKYDRDADDLRAVTIADYRNFRSQPESYDHPETLTVIDHMNKIVRENLKEATQVLLTEAQNYEAMFNGLAPFGPREMHLVRIKEEIDWAKQTLRRLDRITWYMRIVRAVIAYHMLEHGCAATDADNPDHVSNTEALQKLAKKWLAESGQASDLILHQLAFLMTVKQTLEHYLGLTSCTAIQNLRFDRQYYHDLFDEMRVHERQWKETRRQILQGRPDEDEIIMTFPDGFAWVNLNRPNCDDEGDAMGHCGNRYGSSSDKVLSLRKKMGKNDWRPSLTFILDREGLLGEMKGRANEKPKEMYHPYIVALLRHPMVKGIKGGGHAPESNFDLSDLIEAERNKLYDEKPALMPPLEYYKRNGFDETLKAKIEALLETRYLSYKGFKQRGEEWRFVISTADDPGEFLEFVGDKDSKNFHEWLQSADFYPDYRPDDWFEDFVNNLPGFTQKQIMDVVLRDHAEDLADHLDLPMRGQDDDDDQDYFDPSEVEMSDVIAFMKESEEPSEIYEAISSGYATGYQVGTRDAAYKSMTNALDKMEMLTIDYNGEDYDLYLTVENLCKFLNEEYDEYDNYFWGEEPVSVDEPRYGWWEYDEESAHERFYDEAPTEITHPKPPEDMKPINEMSEADIMQELHTYLDDDALARRLQRSTPQVLLKYERKEYWGAAADRLNESATGLRRLINLVNKNA